MDGPHRTMGRLLVVILTATALAATLGATAAPVGQGAWSCRVRNVTRGTAGTDLVAMVALAQAGDQLSVRGTCVGTVVIETDLSIIGSGAGPTLTARHRGRVLRVRSGATATVSGLTIRGGAARAGGGIHNAGRLTLRESTVRGNRAGPRNDCGLVPDPTCDYRRDSTNIGGGILNDGSMTVVASRIRDNEAGRGGGLFNRGTMRLARSTVTGNVAGLWVESTGGGIVNQGTLDIRRSTIARNTAISGEYETIGGGIFNSGRLTISDSSVSFNLAYGQNWAKGGGIANGSINWPGPGPGDVVMVATTVSRNEARTWYMRQLAGSGVHTCDPDGDCRELPGSGITSVRASIIAGNGRDCDGRFTSGGHNLIGADTRDCTGFVDGIAHDRVGTPADPIDPRLGPLGYNGGSTRTLALLPGSPAIDAAGRGPCATGHDQRGVPRPQRERCDIGAFELR